METSVRTLIEAPFPESEIRTRKGTFGKELAYAEVHNYIARLNQAFAGDWSFDITEHRILEGEVVVLGRLTVGDIHKVAFGSSAITTARDGGEVVSVGDDLKAAASDALKKCCSLLGLGLHLYGGGEAAEVESRAPRPRPVPDEEGGGNGRFLSERQQLTILAMAKQRGMSEPDIRTRILDRHGVPLEKLDRRTASGFISELSNATPRRKAAGGAR